MKKILALLLCFVMAFSLVAVAEETVTSTAPNTTEFSDVPATSPYKEAISTLTGLGIILGDAGADTFRPEAGITRAEFCVIVARLKNMGALNVIAETVFTDVTTALCDEWKVKAVRIASDLGIVAGMGDGTFAPDSPVTYEQAVKMLVCLLRYEPMAKGMGGWPAGYIAAGAQIGLTKKAIALGTEPAPRQIIAQLVFNALDIPEMNTSTEGVQQGGNTILDNTLKYTEKKGIVTATSEVSLTEDSYIRPGQVQIDYNKIYNIGSSGADKYFGKEITFYYSEDDGDYTIQSCKLTNSNKESNFKPDQIKHLGQSEIEIYTDEDQDDFNTYSVEAGVKLVYNNAPAPYVESSAGYLDGKYKPYSGSLKLIDNDDNNAIDIIIINDAKPFVVSSIDSTNKLLYNAYDSSDVLDLTESSSKKVTIKKGSSTVEFSSIGKNSNNVLLVSKSLNTTGKKHINVEIVSNTKTGVIKSMEPEERKITIGSNEYKIADICWNKYESKFQMDNSVTVYLDNMNKIIYIVENTTASSYTYGYLISAGKSGQGLSGEKIVAVIFADDGNLKNLNLAEKVKVNNETGKTAAEALVLLDSTARTDINKDTGVVKNTASQLIKYSVNAKDEINVIYTSVPSAPDLKITNNLILDAGTNKATFKDSTNRLGSTKVNSSTKFFFVPSNRTNTDDYAVGNSSALTDYRQYTYETYDLDSSGAAKVAVVFGDISIPAYDVSAPTVVVSKIKEIGGDEDGAAHRFWVNGNTQDSDPSYTTSNASVFSGVTIGDVIKLKVNSKGIVTEVLKLYSPSTGFLYVYEDGATRFAATSNIDIRTAKSSGALDADFCIIQGTVAKKFDESIDISLNDVVVTETDDNGKPIDGTLDVTDLCDVSTASSSTKFYTYSKSNKKVTKVQTLVSFEDGKVGASKVYALLSEGEPKFILTVVE